MSYIEVDCSLIKKDGRVIGVSLVAQPQTEAEFFCASMPKQLEESKGEIKFEKGKVIFVNPIEGEVSFSIENNDASALRAILNGDQRLGLYDDSCLTPGFRIVPEGMDKEGEKVSLTRL
jgi:hypothetical protein